MEKKQKHDEYAIICNIPVGDVEFVLGERHTFIDRYAVWERHDGEEYQAGAFTLNIATAHANLHARTRRHFRNLRDNGMLEAGTIEKMELELMYDPPCLYMRPTTSDERMYLYPQFREMLDGCGGIGYMVGEFDAYRPNFKPAWRELDGQMESPQFHKDLRFVVSALRKRTHYGRVLASRDEMMAYCKAHPDSKLPAPAIDQYGFRLDTGVYTYLLRCYIMDASYAFRIHAFRSVQFNEHLQNAGGGIVFAGNDDVELFRLKDGGEIIVSGGGDEKYYRCRYVTRTRVAIEDDIFNLRAYVQAKLSSGKTIVPAEGDLLAQ